MLVNVAPHWLLEKYKGVSRAERWTGRLIFKTKSWFRQLPYMTHPNSYLKFQI